MNLMQRAAGVLGRAAKAAAGVPVVLIKLDGTESAPLIGTVTSQEYQVVDEQGMVTAFLADDWMFTTAELPWMLGRGDRIRATILGDEATYEVLPLPGGRESQWADTSGVLTIFHTKRVK